MNLHLLPYLASQLLSTHTLAHMRTYSCSGEMPAHVHSLVVRISLVRIRPLVEFGGNQSMSSYILNIYNTHTYSLFLHEQTDGKTVRSRLCFSEILSCSFPSYVRLHIFHACLFVHAQVTVCSATQHPVQRYARSICASPSLSGIRECKIPSGATPKQVTVCTVQENEQLLNMCRVRQLH